MNLPDEVFTHLAYMLQEGEKWQWNVGDYIEEIWQKILPLVKPEDGKTHVQMARKAHADLIRTLAEGTGADKSTLNDRQNMAEFFSPRKRRQYEMLSYSQLRACKKAGPEHWEEWAQWALVNGFYGRPAGVHTIRRAINKAEDPTPDWIRRLNKIDGLVTEWLEVHIRDEDVPKEAQKGMQYTKYALESAKTAIPEAVNG